MSTNGHELIFKDLCYQIVGAAFEVHNELGYGFLEKVYENALVVALRERALQAEQQVPITVRFHDSVVGVYVADILVEESIILELKSAECIADIHRAQAINYLKATGLRLAVIINFGKCKLDYQRIVL
ncbi:MAG TPA: GxxExxY protein [Abditibacteriaceae bacterium]|nr:GxxExxY protein [Abditibacteriaceae bacterium]